MSTPPGPTLGTPKMGSRSSGSHLGQPRQRRGRVRVGVGQEWRGCRTSPKASRGRVIAVVATGRGCYRRDLGSGEPADGPACHGDPHPVFLTRPSLSARWCQPRRAGVYGAPTSAERKARTTSSKDLHDAIALACRTSASRSHVRQISWCSNSKSTSVAGGSCPGQAISGINRSLRSAHHPGVAFRSRRTRSNAC
jgi:hypothetical protein